MEPLAESAGWLFGWLLRNSAHAAILTAVVWALEKTLLRRLSPRWRYGLWLVVFVRLLVPIAPGSALSLFNLVDFAPGAISGITFQVFGLPSPIPVPHTDGPHPLVDTPSWFLGALALWLSGASVLAVLVSRDYRRIRNALARTTPIQDPYILDLLQQSKAVMKVRQAVQLVEGDHVTSPAISGCRRPRLLLPSGLLERLTTDEIRFLFLHELAHVKRADLILNWCLAGIQILHWFNPAIWLALRRLVSVREEVCDDFVLRNCFAGASREYGLTLLHLLEECAPRRLMPALAGILDDVRTLRQRMRCIRTFGEPESHPWIPAGVTLAIAVAGLTENKNHHALALSSTSTAFVELQPSTHHSHRSRPSTPRIRRTAAPSLNLAIDEENDRRRPNSMFQSFSAAFRQAMEDSFGTSSGRSAAPHTGTVVPANPGAPAVAKLPPGGTFAASATPKTTPASQNAATSTRITARPFPLPPVGQRGDIIRPPRVSSDPAVLSGRGHPLEVVPYQARQATYAPPGSARQGG